MWLLLERGVAFINFKTMKFSLIAFISFSTLVNIILAALIVFRLVYHRRQVKNVFGVEHGTLYTRVMTIFVESSALMVIASGVYVALESVEGGSYREIQHPLYPHVCVGGLELDDI